MAVLDIDRPQNRLERGDSPRIVATGASWSKDDQLSSIATWSDWSDSDEQRHLWLRRNEATTSMLQASDPVYRDLPEALKRLLRVRIADHHWLLVEIPKRLGFNSGGTNGKVANNTALADAILDAISDEAVDSPVRDLGEALAGKTGSGSSQRDVWVDRRWAYGRQSHSKPPDVNPDLGPPEGDDSTWRLLELRATSDTQHKMSVPDRLGFPADGIDSGVAAGDRLPTALTTAVEDEASDSPVRALAEALAGV